MLSLQHVQQVLDDPHATQTDKQAAKTRITNITAWLGSKRVSELQTQLEAESQNTKTVSFDVSEFQDEIDQEAELHNIAYHITQKRYPEMSQTNGVFGQIVNATVSRLLEIRKVNAISRITEHVKPCPWSVWDD